MCDVCEGEGGARVIQRDRDGSTAPGSLELLMRSPSPLVFLGSVSVLLSFSPFPPLNRSTLFSLLGFCILLSLHLSFYASYPVTPSNLQSSLLCSSSPFSAF